MRGRIIFYTFNEVSTTLADRLLIAPVRLFSPRFAHCSIAIDRWVFHYGLRGYRMDAATPGGSTQIEAEIKKPDVLLRWESPQRVSKLLQVLRLGLSGIMPKRFRNCSTVIGEALDVDASTPDVLYRALKNEER